MQGDEVQALGELELADGLAVPVVPLTPVDRVVGVVGGLDFHRLAGRLIVDIEGDRAAAVGGVEQVGGVDPVFRHGHGHVEPFARLGPAHVELLDRGLDGTEFVVVDAGLGVGGIHAVAVAELVVVVAVERVQAAAAVVLPGVVVIRHTLPAQVEVRAVHSPRDRLRPAFVPVIFKRFAPVPLRQVRSRAPVGNVRIGRGLRRHTGGAHAQGHSEDG